MDVSKLVQKIKHCIFNTQVQSSFFFFFLAITVIRRYLALETMCLLAVSEFSHEAVKKHQETVINALKTERDVSVRQRAVDLLYAM